MYPLSGPSSEDESVPPNMEREDQISSGELFVWIVRLATVGYTVGFMARLWSDDEIRLHMMHASIRLCQSVARVFGHWALQTEKLYNEYVNSLH